MPVLLLPIRLDVLFDVIITAHSIRVTELLAESLSVLLAGTGRHRLLLGFLNFYLESIALLVLVLVKEAFGILVATILLVRAVLVFEGLEVKASLLLTEIGQVTKHRVLLVAAVLLGLLRLCVSSILPRFILTRRLQAVGRRRAVSIGSLRIAESGTHLPWTVRDLVALLRATTVLSVGVSARLFEHL